jgi:hypothetical protein
VNRLLVRDQEILQRRYTDAAIFLGAAHLRYECYCLAVNPVRTEWEKQRLRELLGVASCREAWFVIQLRNDARRKDIEEYLLEKGL